MNIDPKLRGEAQLRVLMSVQPAISHATQVIPLARELERRRHVVTLATSAPLAATLRRHGLDARPIGPDRILRLDDPVWNRTIGQHGFRGFVQIPDRSSLDDLVDLAHHTGAQLMLREYTEFGGWAVAQRLGIPLVTQGIVHRLPRAVEAQAVESAADLARLARIDAPQDGDELLGSAYLDPVPPSLRCAWEHHRGLTHVARPSLFDGSMGEAAPPWVEAMGRERPLIYVTLGNIFTNSPAVWRAVLIALSALDVDALVTTGLDSDPTGLGAPPANVRIERYIPQSHVLSRCTAVVCHAGFNTVMGALSHGRPLLCLPLGADQPINAMCAASSGAGINGANAPAEDVRGPMVDPEKLDPDQIATAIMRLTSEPAFTDAAARLRREIQAMPGPSETVRTLEALVTVDTEAQRPAA